MDASTIAHYRIVSRLGAGGMGEVYLAEDARLGRRVALKVLPAAFTQDADRVRRFELEARAASALNHPNILTVHDIGQADGIHFIATEHVEGTTLRERMLAARLPLVEALDIAAQVATALAAAHDARIVHRDVKPENIMLRRDGFVKVLDFGLAKLAGPAPEQHENVTSTELATSPGMILGTATYMSPEQARGLEVDARSDLFSLGVVLYEMVTGRVPFGGRTTTDILAAILHAEAPALRRDAPEVPDTLEWIVAKALRKEQDERYQHAKELLADLKRVTRQLERQTEQVAGPIVDAQTLPRPSEDVADSGRQTRSSIPPIAATARPHRLAGLMLIVALLVAAIAGTGFWLSRFVDRRAPADPFQRMQLTRLTTTGRAIEGAISPDGRYAAYVLDDPQGQSIWIRHIATSSHVQIAPSSTGQYGNLTFAPDGNHVYYFKQDAGLPANVLYQVPVLGGQARKITERVHGGLTFSRDGTRLAFARWRPGKGEGPRSEKQLIVMNADGSGERILTSRWSPEVLLHSAWSPDGTVILCTVQNYATSGGTAIVEVRVADGTTRAISTQKWFNVGRMAWLPDGSGLIVPASEKSSSPQQIWHVSYPGGDARRITNDLNGYNDVSLTADSKAFVTVQSAQSSNIWVVPDGDATRARQVTTGIGMSGSGVFVTKANGAGRADGGGGIAWTPDGRIVYHSMNSGTLDVWIMNADGGDQRQLTAGAGSNAFPSVSGSRYVVFQSDRSGRANVWRMDLDGGHVTPLTTDGGELPTSSADGTWVAYNVAAGGGTGLWKQPIDGGSPVRISKENDIGFRAVASPDGTLIACNYLPPGMDWQLRIAALTVDGGRPAHVFEPGTIDAVRQLRWTADGRAITYLQTRQGVSNVWAQPLSGGAPVALTDFKSDLIFSWDWSRDGKQLAVARGQQVSDVVLIADFK